MIRSIYKMKIILNHSMLFIYIILDIFVSNKKIIEKNLRIAIGNF